MSLPLGYEAFCKTLDDAKIAYSRPVDEPVLFIAFQRANGRIDAIVQWHPGEVVEWAMVWPFLVPEARRVVTMEALTAVNFALHVGRFDYDVPNERIVYRAFHVARDQAMSEQQIGFFVSSALFVFDHLYLPLQDVCLRGGDPLGPVRELRRVIADPS